MNLICHKAAEIDDIHHKLEDQDAVDREQSNLLREICDRLLTIETRMQTVAWLAGLIVALLALPAVWETMDETFSISRGYGNSPRRLHLLEAENRRRLEGRGQFDPNSGGFDRQGYGFGQDSLEISEDGHASDDDLRIPRTPQSIDCP